MSGLLIKSPVAKEQFLTKQGQKAGEEKISKGGRKGGGLKFQKEQGTLWQRKGGHSAEVGKEAPRKGRDRVRGKRVTR